ncbi:nudix hydrolase 20 [Carex littledalei]|uniref:Nudix hydrolase 20 n=1 Tax=Carex littledalei TaxID=544730 RepID=A0A833R7E5_9POAL|nr:nudix hydrolase 20 [Carex littledalei]
MESPASPDFYAAISTVSVAQICRSVGYTSARPSTLRALSDIAVRYLLSIGRLCAASAASHNRTDCNLLDLVLSLETLYSTRGFSGGSDPTRPLLESVVLKELMSKSMPSSVPVKTSSTGTSSNLCLPTFTKHLSKHNDVFHIVKDKNGEGKIGEHLRFNPSLKSYEARTEAVAHVIKCLGNLIPGIRNELYPVTLAFGVPPFFSLERAAAPYFGIKAYGVHMNGYVEIDSEMFLWVAKRSEDKPTFPGMFDHIVAGGLVCVLNSL